MKKIPRLYYYTSVETMRFILENGNIYATNLRYMNDSKEYVNGLCELQKIINIKLAKSGIMITKNRLNDEIRNEVTSYSISFSKAEDLLSQWSMYAGESGVCLGFSFTGEEKYKAYKEGSQKERDYVSSDSCPIFPRKVYYCTKSEMSRPEYEETIKNIWQELKERNPNPTIEDIKGNLDYLWKDMTPYVKRVEFKAEAEYRLVFDWPLLLQPFRIDYRNDHHVLKPYLDIECENGWPINEIIVGPGFNQEAVYQSIQHFLKHRKKKSITLRKSRIPYIY